MTSCHLDNSACMKFHTTVYPISTQNTTVFGFQPPAQESIFTTGYYTIVGPFQLSTERVFPDPLFGIKREQY